MIIFSNEDLNGLSINIVNKLGYAMKIYHYTSIEKLALILKNRTLRFNNARNVDDPDEAITEDYGSMQDYVFISSWSKKKNESIPLWKIYGAGCHGVRLETDTKYIKFLGEETPTHGIYKVVQNVKKEIPSDFFINVWQHKKPGIYPYFETNYKDRSRVLKKDISTDTTEMWEYQIDEVFNTKQECWAFEEEIRFILLGCSLNHGQDQNNWQQVFNRIINKEKIDSNYVDLLLQDDFFDNLKILKGPLQNEAETTILKSLVQAHNYNITIHDSSIKLRK